MTYSVSSKCLWIRNTVCVDWEILWLLFVHRCKLHHLVNSAFLQFDICWGHDKLHHSAVWVNMWEFDTHWGSDTHNHFLEEGLRFLIIRSAIINHWIGVDDLWSDPVRDHPHVDDLWSCSVPLWFTGIFLTTRIWDNVLSGYFSPLSRLRQAVFNTVQT